MRPITLNPTLVPSDTRTSYERPAIRAAGIATGRHVRAAVMHLLYLPQVIVALPFLALFRLLDGPR